MPPLRDVWTAGTLILDFGQGWPPDAPQGLIGSIVNRPVELLPELDLLRR